MLRENASSGFDEFLQGIGSDSLGGTSVAGLRVPTLATPDQFHRYLFLGASFSLGDGARARIKGFRQLVTIGKQTTSSPTPRFVECEVTSPTFRLPDGNVAFHLRRLGPPNAQGFPKQATGTDLQSFKKYWADGPALLYQSYTIAAGNRIYTQLTGYTPPNEGKPWGDPVAHLGNFSDLKTQWRTHGAWHSLNEFVEGPATIAAFISVRQSAGTYASLSSPPASTPEEQFIAAFGPGVIYWRVGAALVFEVT